MIKQAQAAKHTKQHSYTQLVEKMTSLHYGDVLAANACMEGVVSVMGSVVGSMNAHRPVFSNLTDKSERIKFGIIVGAKALMDHPDVAAGFNLRPDSLRAIVKNAGEDVAATKAILQVAASAKTTKNDMVSMFQRFNSAIESGDEKTVDSIKREIQRLWYYWQQQSV